jgi:uncharacterized protein (TIGR03437 family)
MPFEGSKRTRRALRARLVIPFLILAFPAALFADLNQTTVLSTSGQSNLNLETGAVSSAGGDIQFSSAGMTPQGTATAINIYDSWPLAQFNTISVLVVELLPGYSTSTIPTATLKVGDVFGVHTNGGHWAKVIVTVAGGTSITLQFTTFGVAASTGSGGPPTITAIINNSSGITAGLPNYGIAPSSIFAIIGSGLADPGTPTLQSSVAPGLPLTLNGASISVTVNGVTTHPAIYYTSPTQIAGVLPASTPVGTGTLTVTYKGVASNAATLAVVPAALGINAYNGNTAVATDGVSYALLTYANSGTPGENIVLWTTGLGANPADSDTTLTSTPHAVTTPLQIYIGGVAATILYQGSAGFPGVNQINVTIPQSAPNGCWISLAAVSNGVLSNIASLPINNAGGQCVDSVTGLNGSQIAPSGSQTLRTGLVALTQTDRPGTNGARVLSTSSDAAFEKYTGIYTPTNQVSPGGCIVNNLTPVSPGPFTGLDPGSIGLTGTGGVGITLANQAGIKGAFFGDLTAGAIPPSGGTFVFKGTGGADVGGFTSTITFTNPILNWTNQTVAASIDRSQNLTVTWTGGNPSTAVFITGTSTSTATSSAPAVSVGFTCLASTGDAQFTVPSYILSALPPGKGAVLIQNDLYLPLPASGLDIGIAQGEVGISAAATYK